jgi:hypothetical protein
MKTKGVVMDFILEKDVELFHDLRSSFNMLFWSNENPCLFAPISFSLSLRHLCQKLALSLQMEWMLTANAGLSGDIISFDASKMSLT